MASLTCPEVGIWFTESDSYGVGSSHSFRAGVTGCPISWFRVSAATASDFRRASAVSAPGHRDQQIPECPEQRYRGPETQMSGVRFFFFFVGVGEGGGGGLRLGKDVDMS